MKIDRTELIDFLEFIDEDIDIYIPVVYGVLADNFLQSINDEASHETANVTENKGKEKVCKHSGILRFKGMTPMRCHYCGKVVT